MSDIDVNKILAEPKTFVIRGMDVKITPLDFKDMMNLSICKKTIEGKLDLTDDNTRNAITNLINKKLKQSLTKIKTSGEKVVPTEEEISSYDSKFVTEYMEKLFSMYEESDVKKK